MQFETRVWYYFLIQVQSRSYRPLTSQQTTTSFCTAALALWYSCDADAAITDTALSTQRHRDVDDPAILVSRNDVLCFSEVCQSRCQL